MKLSFIFTGPIFTGLAASLQQHVLAQMKIKEEHDERYKRSMTPIPILNGNVTITPATQIKTEGNGNKNRNRLPILSPSSPLIYHLIISSNKIHNFADIKFFFK